MNRCAGQPVVRLLVPCGTGRSALCLLLQGEHVLKEGYLVLHLEHSGLLTIKHNLTAISIFPSIFAWQYFKVVVPVPLHLAAKYEGVAG